MNRLSLMITMITMITLLAGSVHAQNSTIPESEEQNGVVKYQEKSLDKEFTFRGQEFLGTKYTDNAKFSSVKKSLEENLLRLRYDAYVMGHLLEYAKDETFRKEYAQDFSKLMTNAIADISDPIGQTWQTGVQSTSAVKDLEDQVEGLMEEVKTNGRYVDAMWMEQHGVSSLTVNVEIDKLGKELRVLNGNGEEISAMFLTSTGDLNGLQKVGTDTTKLVTVAFSPKYESFGILVCPDVYSGEPVETSGTKTVREVELHIAFNNLKASGVEAILTGPGFGFDRFEAEKVMQ